MLEETKYLVALSTFPKFGSKSLLKIKRAFSSYRLGWEAGWDKLSKLNMEDKTIEEFIDWREKVDPEIEWQKLSTEDIKVLTPDDINYPPLLKEIYDPPALLYYKGILDPNLDRYSLAVVGSRKPSAYGKQVAWEITGELARQKLTIVSGLALGIDTLCHEATLKANGRTIAVLGSGLNNEHIYPVTNRHLTEKIVASGGAVISEFPWGALPLRHHFPIRNRLISGLCLGALIIEATEDSGSLITARSALEQNRDVFSIPGSIFSPLSAGPNNLLKMGAKVVTAAQDILDALNLEKAEEFITNAKVLPDSAEEAKLLNFLSREPAHIDVLVKSTELSSGTVASCLTLMEMKGRVRNLGGMMYVLAK